MTYLVHLAQLGVAIPRKVIKTSVQYGQRTERIMAVIHESPSSRSLLSNLVEEK